MTHRERTRASEKIDGLETMRNQMEMADVDRRKVVRLAVVASGIGLAVVVVSAVTLGRAFANPEPESTVAAAQVAPEPIPQPAAPEPAPQPEPASQPELAPEPEPKADPVPEPEPEAKPDPKPAAEKPGVQRISVAIGDNGYEPTVVTAKAGAPISITVAQGDGCAAGFLMPELGVSLDNSTGPATADLGTLKPGEYRFTCGMDMVSGVLQVQ